MKEYVCTNMMVGKSFKIFIIDILHFEELLDVKSEDVGSICFISWLQTTIIALNESNIFFNIKFSL